MAAPTQLPLALAHQPSYGRDDFMTGPSNSAALRLIESWPDWPAPVVLLSGPPGSGKTHLVHIWAAHAKAEIRDASTLRSDRLASMDGAIALEDVAPGDVPEEALFHLINSIREEKGALLVTSESPAESWDIRLPDLRSRLRLAAPVALGAPEDELLRRVLVKLFADRQLMIDKPVIDYVLTRMERSLNVAARLVEALDGEALAAGRRITRPMAAQVLSELSEARGMFADRQ